MRWQRGRAWLLVVALMSAVLGWPASSLAQSGCYAFRLLDLPPGDASSYAAALNDAGQIVGSTGHDFTSSHAVLWDGNGAHAPGALGPAGPRRSSHPVMWQGGVMRSLVQDLEASNPATAVARPRVSTTAVKSWASR